MDTEGPDRIRPGGEVPLVAGVTFYSHDGACVTQSGMVSRIVRGTYSGSLPQE